MKKLLFSVIAFALITLSCNKYKDDFANLNARIDALAAQVQGVATLQTSLTAIQGQLTSLSSAVAAIPNNAAAITSLTTSVASLTSGLATLTTNVAAIQTALNTLATNVAAGNVTTQGLITTLTNQLATNQLAITAAFNAITASAASNQLALMTALNSIIASQSALTTALGTTSTQSAAIKALVDALTVNLATANLNIAILLANSQFYEGSLHIFDESTLSFAETLLNRIALIKGDVHIETAGLNAGQISRLNAVAVKMLSIIGDFTYEGAGTTFTNLSSVSEDVEIYSTGDVGLAALATVGGYYYVTGKDITDTGLMTVGEWFQLDYDGGYTALNLSSVGGDVWLINYTTGGSVVGTTTVNLPALSSADNINGGGAVSFGSASSVNIGAGMLTSLTAAKATSVRLGQAGYTGSLSVSASTTAASSINLSALDSTIGNLSVTGFTGSSVDLSNYRHGTGGSLTVTGIATLNLPKYTSGVISSATVKTLTAAVHDAATSYAGLTILENITLGAATANITGLAATLKTIDLTGKTGSAAALTLNAATYTALTTVKVAGEVSPVSITGAAGDKITSVTTSGVINDFTLTGTTNAGLTSVSLGHTHKVGGPGSYLTITNNTKLTSLTTSTDFAKSIVITGNTALAQINLASYVNTILGGNVDVTVNVNKTTGTYTPTVVGTATTARVEPKYTSTSPHMAQMKVYLSNFTGVPYAPVTATTAATVTYTLGVDDVDPTAGVQTLDAAMTADAGISIANAFNPGHLANVPNSHVNTSLELIKFQ